MQELKPGGKRRVAAALRREGLAQAEVAGRGLDALRARGARAVQDVVRKRPTRLGLESGHTLPMGRGVDVWARWRGRLVHDARSDASSRASHSLEVEAVHRVQPSVEHDHRWLQASDDRVEEAF
jgi:hypothetical protein